MKLSEVMLRCLKDLATDTVRKDKSIAYPTFPTARALHKRGLVRPAGMVGQFPAYAVTPEGRKVLEALEPPK
jgi:hypothetical protein